MKTKILLALLFVTNLTFGQDIGLDPIETTPEKYLKLDPNGTINNWGEDLLLPDDLLTRLKAECKNPVVFKVYDTGQNYNHTDLTVGILPGSNFCNPPGSTIDAQGHSTHVSGIIASNQLGLCRVLFENGLFKLKPVKILSDNGSGSFDWLATAISTENTNDKQLLASGTFVVSNMSLGGGTAKVANVEAALKASSESGVIYCVAAGNTSGAGVQYPGNSQYVLCVASLDQNLTRSSYSTYGTEVWMSEPGRSINSTYLNNQYASLSGTSMATPFQTALCGIALSKWGNKVATLAKMKQYMAWVASDVTPTGKDDATGYGYSLVKAILDKNPDNMGGVTPPNPPNPPTPPTHEVRNLLFTINKNFTMYWGINGAATNVDKTWYGKKIVTVTNGIVSDPTGSTAITITKLEIRVNNTKNFSADEFAKLNSQLNEFFTNRGLGLAVNSDYADATYWSAYFLDLVLKTQKSYDIDVIHIEAKDELGNTVTFTENMLKKF